MNEISDYDAVFSEIADAALRDHRQSSRWAYIRFISSVHKRVLDPLLRQGTSDEVVLSLKTRAREVFNTKKTSCGASDDGQTIRYNDDNIVPRVNGARR